MTAFIITICIALGVIAAALIPFWLVSKKSRLGAPEKAPISGEETKKPP